MNFQTKSKERKKFCFASTFSLTLKLSLNVPHSRRRRGYCQNLGGKLPRHRRWQGQMPGRRTGD
jgi:hypothetical protein